MPFRQSTPRADRRARLAALTVPGLLAGLLSGCGGGGSSPALTDVTTNAHYSYADLGSIGHVGTIPTGISDAGVITGFLNASDNGGGPNQPFRHTGATPVVTADALALPAGLTPAVNAVSLSGINASGTVVGTVAVNNVNSASVQDAFVYDTSFHDLGTLSVQVGGRSAATALAINDSGTVVGYDDFPDQALTFPFRHTGTGPFTPADSLGLFGSYTRVLPRGINQAGVIVGTATVGVNSTQHAFVYDTAYHDLGALPGCSGSGATAINGSGVVIGYGYAGIVPHSFRHTGTGPLTAADDLGQLPGSAGLAATAINAAGDVVGNTGQSGGTPTAFLLRAGGTLQSLSSTALVTNLPAGFGLQNATGINSQGQIVGYTNIAGTAHAWLLTPTP